MKTTEEKKMKAVNTEKQELDAAIDRFVVAMKKKLNAKRKQGWQGWNRKGWKQTLEQKLMLHVMYQFKKGNQEVDIANFCMFLWDLDNKVTKD